MLELTQPLLINILGHAGGALIFAIFLFLLFSSRGWSGARGRNLAGLAATLSLGWNLGSLIVLAWSGLPPFALSVVIAVSFSCLSLLPAVLLHFSLEDSRPKLVTAGYVLSAVAIGLHFREIFGNGVALHQVALLLITVGFLLLTAIAAASVAIQGAVRERSGAARIAASMCLALFAMSFVHFSSGHAHQAWSSELVLHHAGIPLALFVLLQDYRFVLLDAFVRFLANALLAAVLTWMVIEAAFRLVLVERSARDPLPQALLLISVCLLLVVFAWLRNLVQSWLTQAVFRQGGLERIAERLKAPPPFTGEREYLNWSAAQIAAAVRTKQYAIVDQAEVGREAGFHAPVLASALPAPAARRWEWAEAVVPVRLGEGNSRLILLGRRQGGQRYFGEDLESLGRAAAEADARVEALQREEMNRLVTQAELRALQSQINPHFLFNSLNALYGAIPRSAPGARNMVLNLADIFRYFLQTDRTFVPLAEEMQIVRAYLEIERCRLASRLKVDIEVEDAALGVSIPVLSVQPLVENAVKHGIAPRTEAGYVRIRAHCAEGKLHVTVENSGGVSNDSAGPGVGLQNVRRRLQICYGLGAELEFSLGSETTSVEFCVPLAGAPLGV